MTSSVGSSFGSGSFVGSSFGSSFGSCTGSLASVTVTLIDSLSTCAPFVATISNVYDPGPCDSVGVHVNFPVDEFIVAPVGGFFSKLKTTSSTLSVN